MLNVGFDTSDCQIYPIINSKNSVVKTVNQYNYIIKDLLKEGVFTIGQLGLGSDGHTSGLLPNNPLMNSTDYYGYFIGPDYQRITSTPKLISQLDEIVLYVCGQDKAQALQKMLNDGSANEIPARILKNAKKLTIFTDIKL